MIYSALHAQNLIYINSVISEILFFVLIFGLSLEFFLKYLVLVKEKEMLFFIWHFFKASVTC